MTVAVLRQLSQTDCIPKRAAHGPPYRQRTPAREANRESWVPMIAIALGQMIMSFNVASLPVAMGGMVQSFNVPPTTVAHRHRRLFDAGCGLRDAGREAHPALRRYHMCSARPWSCSAWRRC